MGFQIGSLLIPYYGLLISIGIAVAAFTGWIQIKLYKKNYDTFILLAATVGLGAIVGAKLLYLIVSWNQIDFSKITDLTYLSGIMSGGFVFYGGLIGGLLSLVVCKYCFKINVRDYVKIVIPCIPLAHGFGRLGCSAVGCCYGIPYEGFGHIVYENSPIAPNGTALFPVQFTEALINFIIALILLLYIDIHREKEKHSLSLYLLLYAPVRFVLELYRYDAAERGILGGLSTSQWISIAIVFCTVFYLLVRAVPRHTQTQSQELRPENRSYPDFPELTEESDNPNPLC